MSKIDSLLFCERKLFAYLLIVNVIDKISYRVLFLAV